MNTEYSDKRTGSLHGFFANRKPGLMAAFCALAGMASLSFGQMALAQDNEEGKVAVGGKTILTIRTPAEGMTVAERADAIQNRLVLILADPHLQPSDIIAVPMGKNAAKIMVKNRLLVTVDMQTAKINQAKPLALAQTWVAHLREVLPKVNQQPNPNNGAFDSGATANPPAK